MTSNSRRESLKHGIGTCLRTIQFSAGRSCCTSRYACCPSICPGNRQGERHRSGRSLAHQNGGKRRATSPCEARPCRSARLNHRSKPAANCSDLEARGMQSGHWSGLVDKSREGRGVRLMLRAVLMVLCGTDQPSDTRVSPFHGENGPPRSPASTVAIIQPLNIHHCVRNILLACKGDRWISVRRAEENAAVPGHH